MDNTSTLEGLLTHYGEIQNEVEALEANMRDIKRAIETQLHLQGAKSASVDGLASVQLVEAKTSPKFDEKKMVDAMLFFLKNNNISVVTGLIKAVNGFDATKVDSVIAQMTQDGESDIQKLTECRGETSRAGSLRITFKKV